MAAKKKKPLKKKVPKVTAPRPGAPAKPKSKPTTKKK